MTSDRVDPGLVSGNRIRLASYAARHFGWQVEAGVGRITLNRPERKNPLTFESYAELRDLFGRLKYATDVHEIIGPLIRLRAPELLMFTRMTGDLVKAMRHCPQPIIAAMMGCGHARIALTRSPVICVNSSSSAGVRCVSGPMISRTSPPEQKFAPAPVRTTALIAASSRSERK